MEITMPRKTKTGQSKPILTENTIFFKFFFDLMACACPWAHFKKGGIFIALKGLHIKAQGNALGNTLQ
jgi:hypothetical protein